MSEDVLDALENLRHHNALLLQEKRAIESCFEEEAIEKDRLKSTLTEHTVALRDMLRKLRISNRETADSLVSLSERLRPLGLEKLAPPASILQADAGDTHDSELVPRLTTASEQAHHLFRVQNTVLEKFLEALVASERKASDLADTLRLTQRALDRRVSTSSPTPASPRAAPTQSPQPSPQPGDANESMVAALDEEIAMLRGTIAEKEREIRDLRDELQSATENSSPTGHSMGMSLEAELGAAAAMKGMHLWEQTSLLHQYIQLKTLQDELTDDLRDVKLHNANLLSKLETLRNYLLAHNNAILGALNKPVKDDVRKKIIKAINEAMETLAQFFQ
eukprot:m.237565 g.237565  ORF g.237565 m.237565 type:complete len:335 (+) comp21193_c0_seq1:65-1069(+)